jgi:hypothetical protein
MMSYCIVRYDEHGEGVPIIDVLFKSHAQAESNAGMLRKLDPASRYEVNLYAAVKKSADRPQIPL